MDSSAEKRRSAVAAAALAYAHMGWNVVPLYTVRPDGSCTCDRPGCSNHGKHPRAQHGFKNATRDSKLIANMFRSPSNVAVATGSSSGIWVLDVDGPEGESSLERLTSANGPLPITVECITGGGGRHFYFAYPTDRTVTNSVKRIGPGLDTRSDNGGAVAPPSMHLSGRAYAWAPGRSPVDVSAAQAPAWLYEAMDAASKRSTALTQGLGQLDPSHVPSSSYASAALDGEVLAVLRAQEGTRNDTLHKAGVKLGSLVAAGLLDRSGAEHALVKAGVGAGLPSLEAAATAKSGLDFGGRSPRDMAAVATASEERRRAANTEAQAGRRKRLRDSASATGYLTIDLGLTEKTVEHFGFGLDRPYTSPKTSKTYSDALTFPLRNAAGDRLSTICKADVPGVTINPKGSWWSAAKEPDTFYANTRGATSVLVCDMVDVWRLWQETGEASPIQIIASTSDDLTPNEWSSPTFWDQWEVIYVGTPVGLKGDRVANSIHRSAGKIVHRMQTPPAGWTRAFVDGADQVDLDKAISSAAPIEDAISTGDEVSAGRKAYRPLDIGRAFHQGHLYYPVDTLMSALEEKDDGSVRVVEHIETIVIRSDGKQLHTIEVPAPKGTAADKRVLRLSDGTLIDSLPKAPAHPSWSWAAIAGWLAAKSKGEPIRHRPFSDIIEDVLQAFRAVIWLPYEEDYTVLALTAAASYCQAVFQSVPLLLLSGEAGSGKSTAGIAISMLSANGTIVGQVNAAAAARLIHETRGLVVLDDLEAISSRPGKDGNSFGELVQWLKVSYNRDTATKVWVDASRNFKVERLNGFGIKVVNNTTGVDSILGTRMIRIQTRKMPPVHAEARRKIAPPAPDRLQALRDEMHAWMFDNVAEVAATYSQVCPSASERSDEIAAPLRVLARLSNVPQHAASLEAALARGGKASFSPDDPAEVLQEAATLLAREGYIEISPTHVILEMKRLVDAHFGQSSTTEIPEYQQPEWVGRMLRLRDILASGQAGYRKRLFGKNLRVYPFSQHFLDEALAEQAASPPPAKQPTDFCCGCASCPYRSHACPMMNERMEVERSQGRKPVH